MILLHPQWNRSCDDCVKWLYDDETGEVVRRPYKVGLPQVRPLNPDGSISTPCRMCPKIPLDAPARTMNHAIELSRRNEAALQHYLECQAVGVFPDDPLVRRHAVILKAITDQADRAVFENFTQLMVAICQLKQQ